MIRRATQADLNYIDSLQRKNATALSFYPRQVFERETDVGRIILVEENGDPIGYLWRGAFSRSARIHQACIQFDARRLAFGAEAIAEIEREALAAGSEAVCLRCAGDVDANEFWRAIGYLCVAVVRGGSRRSRDINCWRKPLQPELFNTSGVTASTRPMSAAAWSANRQSGASRFHRGKRLLQFRSLVEGVK